MKKHENAIKALMKNVKDNEKWYGYFENENGERYLMNMHIVIKLTGSTLDYVGELPRLDNIKLVKQFIDFIETFKKGEYKTTVNIQDIKIFDRYNTDKKPFCVNYSDNSYIGFNPYYFNKLNILTGSDLLTITDSKSPIYIASDNIECVLLPCSLDKNYNSDNYNDFKTLLQSYYKQDQEQKQAKQEQKALKNTDKIEKEVIYNGFTLYFASRQLFILSDKKRVTNDITNDFLEIMSDITGIDYINKITENDYKYYKSGVQTATITKTTSYYGNEEIYRIETKYNSENFYKNELDRLIIYNGNMEKIDICANDITATDEETPKTATIQDNNADIVKADTVKDDTCTATDTAVTTETATNDRKKVLHGFYMTFKNRDIFVATNEDTKRRYIVQAFISEMINISNHLQNITEEKRNKILNDEEVLNETKKRITPATIEEIWTSQENHIRITSDNNNMIVNHSLNNFKTIIIDCYSANEGGTPVQEKSLKFFSGISRLNNQLTETITQDIKADLQADNRQTETTQDTTPTQDKPQKTSNKSVSLFIVTDKPQPVKLPHLKPLNNIPMYVERFKTDFKQRNNARVYKYRVSNKKALKKAHNDFIGTVSCYNDKCAIGGGSVAVNSS